MRSPVSLLTLSQTGHCVVSAISQVLSKLLADLSPSLCPDGQLPPVRGGFSKLRFDS
jgi:hypothetical protein